MRTMSDTPPDLTDRQDLLCRGILAIDIDTLIDCSFWAGRFASKPPLLMFTTDEEPRYRNIIEEPNFPFSKILGGLEETIHKHFGVSMEELRLDDAFAIHYHIDQDRTHGAKHVDPSDITINICLDASDDVQGSHVKFHGSRSLGKSDYPTDTTAATTVFSVCQQPRCATLHWGDHAHETTRLERGYRTNVILTLCYKDKTRSDVASRSCYHV